jgi:hypothetical protein
MSIKKTITYALDSVASESTATIKIDVKKDGSVISTKDYNMTIRPAKADKYSKWVVFAVAGQSNSVGYDESENTTMSNPNSDPDRIKQVGYYGDDNLKIIPLQSMAQNLQNMIDQGTAANKKGTKGLHLPLAELIAKHIPDDYGVLVVPVAYGMTFFTRSSGTTRTYNATKMQPDPEATNASNGPGNDFWTVNSAYHQTLRDRVKWALDQGEGKTVNKFAGVIWCQGEADTAQFGGTSSNHGALFQALVSQLATDWADYNQCSSTGAMDKSVWFVHDTTLYWRQRTSNSEGVDVSTIWKQYQQYLPLNHVVNILPLEEYTNAVNGGGTRTSSAYTSHYGNNAYRDIIAPRVLDAMLQANVIYGQDPSARNTTTFTKITTKLSCRAQGLDIKENGDVIWACSNIVSYTINNCGWSCLVFDEDIKEVKIKFSNIMPLIVYQVDPTNYYYKGLLLGDASNFAQNVSSYDRFWILKTNPSDATPKDLHIVSSWNTIDKTGISFLDSKTVNKADIENGYTYTITVDDTTNQIKVVLNDTDTLIDTTEELITTNAKPRIGVIYGWTVNDLTNNSVVYKILSATKKDGTVIEPIYSLSSDSLSFTTTDAQTITVNTTGTISNLSKSSSIIDVAISDKTITVTPSDSGEANVTFDIALENGSTETVTVPVTVSNDLYYNYFTMTGQKNYGLLLTAMVATGSGNKKTSFNLDTNIPISEITIKDEATSVAPYVTFDLTNKCFTFISSPSDCLSVTFMWNGIELGTAYVIFSSSHANNKNTDISYRVRK